MFRRHHDVWVEAIEAWTVWLDASNSTATTLRQRRWQLRTLAEMYANRSPWKLTTTNLIEWYTRPNWGPSTRHSARSAVRSFYEWGTTVGRTKRNPAGALPRIVVTPGLPRPASEEVLQRAMAAADDRARLMLVLAGYAGLRDAEIAGLRWSDITDTHLIVVGKRRKTRQVWKHPAVTAELDAERSRRDVGKLGSGYRLKTGADVYVFPGQNGGPMSPCRVCQLLSRALGKGVTGHQLRHRFATSILERTGDLAAVQELLGHASPQTTRIYTRVSTNRLRSAVDSLGTAEVSP